MTSNREVDTERKIFPADTEIGEAGSEVYILESVVDCGGEAIVYRARAKNDGHVVAVKLLYRLDDPMELKRFRRVVEIQSKVRGINVLPLEESGIFVDGADSYPFFVFPFIKDGRTLERILQEAEHDLPKGEKHKGTVIPYAHLLHYASQAGNGLLAVHTCGVVHRDVKPSNILIAGTGTNAIVRLMDLGVSKFYKEDLESEERNLTIKGCIRGTPAYLAPEGAYGRPGIVSDIWAFGVVLYEMVTHRSPFNFESGNMMSVLTKVAHGNLKPIAIGEFCEGVDPHLEALIMRCLAHDPADRPQSMEDVLEELNRMQLRLPHVSVSDVPPAMLSFKGKSVINPEAETLAVVSTPQKLEQAVILQQAVRSKPLMDAERLKTPASNRHVKRMQEPTVVVKAESLDDRKSGLVIAVIAVAVMGFAILYFGWYSYGSQPVTTPAVTSIASSLKTLRSAVRYINPTASNDAPKADIVPEALPSVDVPVTASATAAVSEPAKSSVPPKPTGKHRSYGGQAPLPQPGIDYVPGSEGQ